MATSTSKSRARSGSIKEALDQMEPIPSAPAGPLAAQRRGGRNKQPAALEARATSPLTAWLIKPTESLKLIVITVTAWFVFEWYTTTIKSTLKPFPTNPLSHLLFVSYPLTRQLNESTTHYDKGYLDYAFLGFYIIVFSFLRQSLTEFVIRPFAKSLGIKSESKLLRFMEQSYAIVYFSASGAFGLYVMSSQKSWWYKTEHFWLEYPHWRMAGPLKSYYLLQLSYWIQQMLVLLLRLEKPRSDFKELVIHHVVTLWLVGWSYFLNLTMIGTCIFVSMDIPDVFLALSKCLNYLDLQRTSEVSFVWFLIVWHYMRHYLNIKILFSVMNEFDLIPKVFRTWTENPNVPSGWWLFYGRAQRQLPQWMKYQIFAPILALQLVNTFWSFLIWRILYRMIQGTPVTDVREEGEDDESEVEAKKRVTRAESKKQK